MIVKAGPELRGSRSHGLLAYLLGDGRHTVHHDPRVVAGWLPVPMLPGGLDPSGRVPCRTSTAAHGRLRRHPQVGVLARALDAPVRAVDEAMRPAKHVWHCVVQNDPRHDPVLSDEQWASIAAELVDAVGLAEHRWVAVRHDDHGIHIAATLVDESGERARLSFEKKRLNDCRVRLEARHCRRRTDPGTRTGGISYQRHEVEKARREHRRAPAKTQLRRAINEACVESSNPDEFAAHLAERGVDVGWRRSTIDPNQITGYKVSLRGHTTADGEPVWYKASDVDRALTWPKIEARWANRRSETAGRTGAASGNDYAARLALAARRLRESPELVDVIGGPLSDVATAVCTSRSGSRATSDSAFWATRLPGGAGRRRHDHGGAGLTAVARFLSGSGGSPDLWVLIARNASAAFLAVAAAHTLHDRARQAEQAALVAAELESAARVTVPARPPAADRTPSRLDGDDLDARRPDLGRAR